ncbi:Isochorismatase domain-containing protein [Aphelenchoides besseyi]|nr:Isochorismatase domain-containing protein [Aphelenchoides besseyi]
MSPSALSKIASDANFETFSAFIRSLVVDESPSNEDMLRIFNVFDQDKDGILNKQETEQVNKRIVRTINHMRSSLIVVDFQNDFKGRAQQDPQEAIPLLNHLLSRHQDFNSVVYTMDWHPSNHSRKLKPFDVVTFEEPNCRQVLYPSHCVENSWGADLNASVQRVDGAKYVRKGTDIYVDAYSGFADNNGKIKSDLENILRDDRINTLFICGLALDICVASTARDASKLKFFTKGLSEEQIKRTCLELRGRNVPYVETHEVDQFLEHRKIPWLWICQMVGLGERRRRRRKHHGNGTTVDVELTTESPDTPHGTQQSLLPGVCHEVIHMDAS